MVILELLRSLYLLLLVLKVLHVSLLWQKERKRNQKMIIQLCVASQTTLKTFLVQELKWYNMPTKTIKNGIKLGFSGIKNQNNWKNIPIKSQNHKLVILN